MSPKTKINQVILILMDCVRASHFFEFLNQGKLPNIAQLAKNGISCENCITSFPSITFPCCSNIVTGSYSGYYPKEGSGIPTYHWLNRTDPPTESKKLPFIRDSVAQYYKLGKDLGPNVQTIFEQAGEGNFLSARNIIIRGSRFQVPKEDKSVLVLKIIEDAFKNPKKYFPTNEVPRVSIGYLSKSDNFMHNKGFNHPDYINEVLSYDEYIGSLVNTLKDTGYYDSTAVAIISDHGNYKSKNIGNLEPFIEKKGLIPYVPKKVIGDFDVTFGSVGFFNFRGDTWHHHPTIEQLQIFKPSKVGSKKINLFETLWEIPGVKLMYYRGDENTPDKGIIHLERRENNSKRILKGQIDYEGYGKKQKTKYTFDDEDLFGYDNNANIQKVLDDKPHDIDEWLSATNTMDFPIIIDQIPRYFKNPRACDIMVSTSGEYSYGYEHGQTMTTSPYSHDIALKKSMTVPLIIGGSLDVPNFQIPYCKTTDMVPTLLDLLGMKPHRSVVGKSLLNLE